MSSNLPPSDGPPPGRSGDLPRQWSSYDPVEDILFRDSSHNPVFYDSSSDEDNVDGTDVQPEPLPCTDLDVSLSGSEHGGQSQQDEFKDEPSLDGNAVVAQSAEATGSARFFEGWFRKRRGAPVPLLEVPIPQQSVPGSNPMHKSEDRGLSDKLEGLGEETGEPDEEKKKGKLLMKAAALAVIGGAGAYSLMRKLDQDNAQDDDPGAANSSDPTSAANNTDASAVANPPDSSAAMNPPDMSAAATQNDGGVGLTQHASASHYDGGAGVVHASQGDGGATILQSHNDGGAIILQGKQVATTQATPNAAPPPSAQLPLQVQQMAVQAAQGAATSVAVGAEQVGGAAAAVGATSAGMTVGVVAGVAVAVAAVYAAAGTIPAAVQTAQEIVSISPSTSLFPSFAPSLFCERANEENAFTNMTVYNRIQLFNAEERPVVEGAFVNVYNNLSFGCDDAYNRVLTDANMTEQALSSADVNGTMALDMSWYSTVLCDQCPPTSPIFDDENQFGGNNSQRMLRKGIFLSDFTLRFLREIQRLASVGMISPNWKIETSSEIPTDPPSALPSQSSMSPTRQVLSHSPTSIRSETPSIPAPSTRTPSSSFVPTLKLSDPQLDPTSGPSTELSTKPTVLSSDGPSFASSFPSLSLSSFPSQAPVSPTPVVAPSPAPTVQGAPSLAPVEIPSTEPVGKASDQIETMEPSLSPSVILTLDISSQPTPNPIEQATDREQISNQPTARPSDSKLPSSLPSQNESLDPSVGPSLIPTVIPSIVPTQSPSSQPSGAPSSSPSNPPTDEASVQPSTPPSSEPSSKPSNNPSVEHSALPSPAPSSHLTILRSVEPSTPPSAGPSSTPSNEPSIEVSNEPIIEASNVPSMLPSGLPTIVASVVPSTRPSPVPSANPSNEPSVERSAIPSPTPSVYPTINMSLDLSIPSSIPSYKPSVARSEGPSSIPSNGPSIVASITPTTIPSAAPSSIPSNKPSAQGSTHPTALPSYVPTLSASAMPSSFPSTKPSLKPSNNPTVERSAIPSPAPSTRPSAVASVQPSEVPSGGPSSAPSNKPSIESSSIPSSKPSDTPTVAASVVPTMLVSSSPSNNPTVERSAIPSPAPSTRPSTVASVQPSEVPSGGPSSAPSNKPSIESSGIPSSKPSDAPTVAASVVPTMLVSSSPSNNPTVERSAIPSPAPSTRPSAVASVQPSEVPSGGPSSAPSNKPSIESSSFPSLKPSDAIAVVLTAPPATRSSLIPSNNPSVEWSAIPSPAPSSHPSTVPSGNDFVDSSKGSISGNVTSTHGIPIPNIVITLTDSNGNIVTTTTGTTGEYAFENLAPGNYSLTAESHASGTHNEVDNRIEVTLEGGSRNQGNNFVMTLEPKIPTSGPSENPPAVAPVTSVPTAHVALSKYCEELDTPGCGLCTAFHSPDYCNPHESFASLIQNRTHQCRSDPGTVASDGYWFHYLEDKIAGYVLSIDQSAPAPKIFCCVTSHDQLRECLENRVIPENPNGIVIKATSMHSNQGVFVLVNDTKSSADDPIDLLTGLRTSYIDAVTALTYFQASKIIVEEFIGTSLPTEYKFHVINGKVAAIDIIDGRGSECPCYAVVDTNWTRLDQFGCFEPGGFELVDSDTGCTAVDWKTGKRKAGPIKKDLNMCDEVPKPSNCLVQDMSAIALKLGNRIGVAMRIDMFVEDDTIYVQEYSPNHMNGIRHCAAKMENGCIDSCFLGRMWDAAGGDYGGDLTTVPLDLIDYHTLTAQQQCDLLMGKNPPIVAKSC